jgi:hypothetical protein
VNEWIHELMKRVKKEKYESDEMLSLKQNYLFDGSWIFAKTFSIQWSMWWNAVVCYQFSNVFNTGLPKLISLFFVILSLKFVIISFYLIININIITLCHWFSSLYTHPFSFTMDLFLCRF